jgi:hypothetical protein
MMDDRVVEDMKERSVVGHAEEDTQHPIYIHYKLLEKRGRIIT